MTDALAALAGSSEAYGAAPDCAKSDAAGTAVTSTAGHGEDYAQYSPLALAYIGDAVYELIIRDRIVREGSRQVNKLHHETVHYVNAGAQSRLVMRMQELLTPQEMRIYKRGRNAVSHTVPKNQDVADYRRATGFEALIGWLFLSGNYARIYELLDGAQSTSKGCTQAAKMQNAGA